MNRKTHQQHQQQPPTRVASGAALQGVFARRREHEQQRLEKNSEVARYYDKWGRITTRFENWTAPEYYERNDEMLRKEVETKRRSEALKERQEKLKSLLEQENEMYRAEIEADEMKRKPNATKQHSVDILEKVNESLAVQEKRKNDLEAKLYMRWRFGMTRDDLILESTNAHQAMAKLNWLDKQVEEQLEKEREKKELDALQQQKQADMVRLEELALENRKATETEKEELRRVLEFHILELKSREKDCQRLRQTNSAMEEARAELELEKRKLEASVNGRQVDIMMVNNARRLKIVVRNHCEQIAEGIAADIAILERIKLTADSKGDDLREQKNIQLIAHKFDRDLTDLKEDNICIISMYDSEIKSMLLKQDRLWRENAMSRYRLLDNLLEELMAKCDAMLRATAQELGDLIQAKERHLKTIEETHLKLKKLNAEIVGNESYAVNSAKPENKALVSSMDSGCSSESNFSSVGDQLQSLNLIANEKETAKDSSTAPRFGRKKMAWC